MNIDQIKYLLAVNKYKSFSHAADEICISQSSLSKQIKNLEREFDTILIDRKSRTLALTEAGRDFIVYAEALLDTYNQMVVNMKKHSSLKKGHLSLAAIPVMSQYGITSILASFYNKHPHIDIEITEKENDLILEMIRNAEVDLALMRTNYLPEGFGDIYPLMEDELVLVTPNDHPLSCKKSIDLNEAAGEKFIFLNPASGIYRTCVEECNKAQFEPNLLYTNSRIETIIGLVSEGLGVSLLMKRIIESFDRSKFSIVPLNQKVTSTIALVTPRHKEVSDNTKAFIEFIVHSNTFHD